MVTYRGALAPTHNPPTTSPIGGKLPIETQTTLILAKALGETSSKWRGLDGADLEPAGRPD